MKHVFKRLFDIAFSLLAILFLSPFFLVIPIIIKISDKGPAFFKHQRIGKNEKPFVFYKFRSMKLNADPYGLSPDSFKDPRLIKCGRFLREFSLDELPQFFNVLKGDMSIVGPRPLYPIQIAEMNDYHKQRLNVKPGITGFSQIYMRSSLTTKESLDMEVDYVKTQSFWLDIKIIFKTIAVVLGKKGVY